MRCGVNATLRRNSIRFASTFAHVKMGPPDPILGLGAAFKEDPSKTKVNLAVGVYRGDDSKPFVLECVKIAQSRLLNLDHEYAPITGLPSFVEGAQKLAFSADAAAVKEKRIASSQVLSGTGALRVAGDFLHRHYPSNKLAVPTPSWGNHKAIFTDSGFNVGSYTYYNPAANSLNVPGLLESLRKLEPKSVVLFHACAHNPSGIDPTQSEWRAIVSLVKELGLFPLVDMAYQGFASGDPDRDAFAARLFASECPAMALCQSFAKSFGLYGQRCGAVHFLCESEEEMKRLDSQLKILIRPMYSNPPLHGARIVDTIFKDPKLYSMWRDELRKMADRMATIRVRLVEELKKIGSKRDWSHITKQIGMMAFTGLNKEQVARLKNEFHIYMTDDGRAAISGLNSTNVEYVAKCFHQVTQ